MRLCDSHLSEEHFMCYQTSQRNWVIIKELYRCLQRYMLGWRILRLGFVTSIVGEVSLGPLGNTHHISLASIATNELVARWCIMKRVRRLAGNEIELGIEIPTIESRASNIPMTKGTRMLLCGSTDKDLRRICRSQYGHPGSAIGYWAKNSSRSCLHSSRTRRVRTLNVRWWYSIIWVMYVGDWMLFGVPDEITDMTRNSRMVRI